MMRFSSLPLVLMVGTLAAAPAVADSNAIGTIQVSPDLRSALQSAAGSTATINVLQQVQDKVEIENSLEIAPVPPRPAPQVYRQFEEPRRRGIGFRVGI